jgi:hypothetical protein
MKYVEFEVSAMVLNGPVLCSPLRKIIWRFGGTCDACYAIHIGFSLGLFFYPEDGVEIYLRNIGYYFF